MPEHEVMALCKLEPCLFAILRRKGLTRGLDDKGTRGGGNVIHGGCNINTGARGGMPERAPVR